MGKSEAKNRYEVNISHTATNVACHLQVGTFPNITRFFNPLSQSYLDHAMEFDPTRVPEAFITVLVSQPAPLRILALVSVLSGYNLVPTKSLGRFSWNPREVLVVAAPITFSKGWFMDLGSQGDSHQHQRNQDFTLASQLC